MNENCTKCEAVWAMDPDGKGPHLCAYHAKRRVFLDSIDNLGAILTLVETQFERLDDPINVGSDCGALICDSVRKDAYWIIRGAGFDTVEEFIGLVEERTSSRWVYHHTQLNFAC